MSTVTLWADETDPDTRLAWKSLTGTLRNFTGWTMSVEVVHPTMDTIQLTKTSGVTGGDGTGLSNVNIAWTAAELAQLDDDPSRLWRLRAKATQGSEVAVFSLDARGTLPRLRVLAKPV